ncbi:hypothetical protein D7030_10950 [Flavobacteriaceae bacterium AU392]|nr:hypothetical protein D1817_13720 [Flavobacteriaceae bacterium]RKM82679.1 hypothetical protein D7030_10950 [Flavobacteriaceae bacterium AU392]
MRVNWNYIKALLLLGVMVFLFAFSSKRNDMRTISDVEINFFGEENLFVTHETVNKLLIQNKESATKVPKDILDLNRLELALKSNPMIKTAQVYLSVNGEIKADVVQRKPIARVNANTSYYIDEDGLVMPLSNNYAARTPLITGFVKKDNLKNVYAIADKIYKDEFLKTHVVEIYQAQNLDIKLKMRVYDFEILIGDLNNLDKKINNLKAFYQKAKKDKSLNKYSKVNLQFENQVVCTKK